VLGKQRVGLYADSETTDCALPDGLGSYVWERNRGSPTGVVHRAAHLRQVETDKRSVGGIGVGLDHLPTARLSRWDQYPTDW
jgi:hypothetical protein